MKYGQRTSQVNRDHRQGVLTKVAQKEAFREYCSKGYTLIKDEMRNGEKDCEILQVLDFLLQIGIHIVEIVAITCHTD